MAGRSRRDLATATGLSQPTIQRRLASAVDRLRQHLVANGHAGLGGAAIATNLPTLGQANVPPTVTAELTKLGLAAPTEVARLTLATKASLVAGGLAVAAGVGWLAIAAGPTHVSPAPTMTAAPTTTFADAKSALASLATTYRLADGEDIASFLPPYPAARAAHVELQLPYAGGSANVNSVGFEFGPNGLSGRYMRYPDPDLKSTIEVFLSVPWHTYDATALGPFRWRFVESDWVVRQGLSVEQKLAALASYLGKEADRTIRFERRIERRPCIIHAGRSDRVTPKNDGNIGTVLVSQTPPTDDQLARLANYQVPAGTRHAFQFDVACRWLDAPLFSAGEPDFALDSRIFYVPRDADLSRTDPAYRDKLQRTLDNVAKQVGGEWRIEDRDVETWVAVVSPK